MCDTMVALGKSTKDGTVLFAKNSDRQPNEPHIMVRVPAKRFKPGEKVKCTYIEVEQSEATFEVLLLKPSWIWGCEMGFNEHGLNIGNEAVFTREKYGDPRLTGMDMVRLALERCRTSQEALDYLVELLGKYGQGGNCGYEKQFTYHNSFLIADRESAWVLETAGEYWAAEKVQDVRSISNCLSIGKHFDRAHPKLIEHAVNKGWCKSEKDFDFARCYSDPLFTYFSGARIRREQSQTALDRDQGHIDVKMMMSLLRSHHPNIEGRQFEKSSLKSLCMHGGGLIGDHTTGSYVASLGLLRDTYWITGASTPCLAAFKPYWMVEGENASFQEKERSTAVEFWKKRERLHRMVLANQVSDVPGYTSARNELEQDWLQEVSRLNSAELTKTTLRDLMDRAWKQENELICGVANNAGGKLRKYSGGLYFRRYWKKQTSRLNGE
ncbi:MAG: C69 family dipeptidase [Ignavibacteriales bacterium]